MSIKQKDIYSSIKRNRPYFEDFITRSIYHSNAIEGNTMSYAETYSIVFNDNSMLVNATAREIYEAINLKYAFHYVLEHYDEELTVQHIKDIAILVNKNINEIAGFRTGDVYIRGAAHIPPKAKYIPSMISELLFRRQQEDEDIFDYLASFHLEFERIHPFSDGNGRTGRLLIVKELFKQGYAPIVVPLEERNKYMSLLAGQDVKGLSAFFRKLNEYEEERIARFGIALVRNTHGEIEATRTLQEITQEALNIFGQ